MCVREIACGLESECESECVCVSERGMSVCVSKAECSF